VHRLLAKDVNTLAPYIMRRHFTQHHISKPGDMVLNPGGTMRWGIGALISGGQPAGAGISSCPVLAGEPRAWLSPPSELRIPTRRDMMTSKRNAGWQLCVAIVDDDDSVRKALARVLRAANIHVLAFESGRAFLDSMRLMQTRLRCPRSPHARNEWLGGFARAYAPRHDTTRCHDHRPR